MLWTAVIDLLRALIFTTAQVCNGSLGVAVCLVSIVLRLVLLPLTLRLARRALAHQRRLLAFKPQVDRIQARFAKDPAAQLRETVAFYERQGVKQVDSAALWGAAIQMPIFAALYSALRKGVGAGVRFLWVGDLSLPNFLLTLVVTTLTVAGVALSPGVEPGRRVSLLPLLFTAGITVWILLSTPSVFAVATGAGSLVSVLQAVVLRRSERVRTVAT